MKKSTFTFETFNQMAAIFDLELVNAQNYFYWRGLRDDIPLLLDMLSDDTVQVSNFYHLSPEQWIAELKKILSALLNEIAKL